MIDDRVDEATRARARTTDVDWRDGWLGPGDHGLVAYPATAAARMGVDVLGVIDVAFLDSPLEPVRRRPAHAAEMVTEVRAGERLARLRREGDWWLVQGEDGYVGWIHDWVLVAVDPREWTRWRERRLGWFAESLGTLWVSDHRAAAPLVLGTPLFASEEPVRERREHRLVCPPSGLLERVRAAEGWIEATRIECEVVSDAPRRALLTARMLLGTPYRWGGRSPLGFDCSGFVQFVAERAGVELPRDAAQQQRVGEEVPIGDRSAWRAGDLLLFGEPADHVGIHDGRGGMIHCRGRVRVDELGEIAPLMQRLSAVRRPWERSPRSDPSLWLAPSAQR